MYEKICRRADPVLSGQSHSAFYDVLNPIFLATFLVKRTFIKPTLVRVRVIHVLPFTFPFVSHHKVSQVISSPTYSNSTIPAHISKAPFSRLNWYPRKINSMLYPFVYRITNFRSMLWNLELPEKRINVYLTFLHLKITANSCEIRR